MMGRFTGRFPKLAVRKSLLISLLFPVALCASLLNAQQPAHKSILIINEGGLVHPASALVTERLLERLPADPKNMEQVFVESLDTPISGDEESLRNGQAWLLEKYKNRKVDVVVAMGPSAVNFVTRYSSEFLPDVPVVICGAFKSQAGNPVFSRRFTGSWMALEPAKTVDVALQLLPETRHLFVVGGNSTVDKSVEEVTKASLLPYEKKLDVVYLTDLDITSLLDRIRRLPSQSVVLYVSLFRDENGNQFASAGSALPLISNAANAPVFGMSDTYMGNGIIGGYLLPFEKQGRIAADMVERLLDGEKAGDIPVQVSPSAYMFDARQMERWKLDRKHLPQGSIIRVTQPTLWQRAGWIIIASALVICVLSLLIGYLLHKQRQLESVRQEQNRLSGRLIAAQEEERQRLAAELHDDFSQRLALLSFGLETAAEDLGDSPALIQRMNELIESASEIGADLHTLSHRLHSSTLARLGLAPGIASFCKEFAARNETKVTFSSGELPRYVSSEIGLALFRIVQEGLRNVRKHSGAANAEVKLNANDGRLHLSISDDGQGFEVRDTFASEGVGLWSMKERARMIGARFKISSEKGRGTRIDVSAPLASRFEPQSSEDSERLSAPAVTAG